MKLLKKLTLISLIIALLTGCGAQAPGSDASKGTPATPEEEQAIQQVIIAYDKAYFNWDTEGARACVMPDYPMEDTREMLVGAFDLYVDQGDMVPEDLEKFLEIEKKYYQKGSEQLQYRNWEITVSGDSATALITYGYPNADSTDIFQKDYRDKLFLEVCQMDEQTAKETLSPKEFSSVYLQVTDLDYTKRTTDISYIESTVELRLQKVDGQWYIAELVLPEA